MTATARAQAWRNRVQATVCDVVEPWAHGTIARATRYPSYFDFNTVRVEQDPGMSVEELIALADEALAGLRHRRLDFDLVRVAEPLRAGFEAAGWHAERLVWMRHEVRARAEHDSAVEEVPYDDVHRLRVLWHDEDFPGQDSGRYHVEAREVALRCGARVLAVHEAGVPIAFAQLESDGSSAEVTQVFVHPDHRGGGHGTAITSAAIEAAGDVRDLWIVADDEDRPKELYARLGFRPAWTAMEFMRLP